MAILLSPQSQDQINWIKKNWDAKYITDAETKIKVTIS